MQFKEEVQKKFEKAGWYNGRNISSMVNKLKGINECPELVINFLNEYGNLEIVTETKYAKSTLNFKMPFNGWFENMVQKDLYFINRNAFPLGYYEADHAILYTDNDGKIYMGGDFPTLMSNDFKTGIEKVIMEDYSNTLEWNPETKQWVEEY